MSSKQQTGVVKEPVEVVRVLFQGQSSTALRGADCRDPRAQESISERTVEQIVDVPERSFDGIDQE